MPHAVSAIELAGRIRYGFFLCRFAKPRRAGNRHFSAFLRLEALPRRSQRGVFLHAIVDPSADFALGYAPIAVTLKTGGTVMGVLMGRDAKVTKARVADGQIPTLEFEKIASTTTSALAMLPTGKLMSLIECRDFVAF